MRTSLITEMRGYIMGLTEPTSFTSGLKKHASAALMLLHIFNKSYASLRVVLVLEKPRLVFLTPYRNAFLQTPAPSTRFYMVESTGIIMVFAAKNILA